MIRRLRAPGKGGARARPRAAGKSGNVHAVPDSIAVTDMREPPPPTAAAADPDLEVVERVRRGEHELFELLVRRHNPRVFRIARAIVGDGAEAEDVMQEAYVRAFAALAGFGGRARFSTWLARIVVHEALARRRRRTPHHPDEVNRVVDHANGPEEAASSAEVRRLLEHAIARLEEPFRLVFVLRAVEQMPAADVADCLQIEEATVNTRYFRARSTLKGLLAQHAEALAPHLFHFQLQRCDRVVANVLRRILQ
jgi:RNA polymerase sigma-70 factor (ECF subfamily)